MRQRTLWAGLAAAAGLTLLTGATAAGGAPTVAWGTSNATGGVSIQPASGAGSFVELGGGRPAGLAFDLRRGRIYWTDGSSIRSSALDGGDPRVISTGAITVSGAKGLALDPATGIIYWTNSTGDQGIYRVDPATGVASILYPDSGAFAADIAAPQAPAVNPGTGRIYWSNGGGNAWIAYATMDGSSQAITSIRPHISPNTCTMWNGRAPGTFISIVVDPVTGDMHAGGSDGSGYPTWTMTANGSGCQTVMRRGHPEAPFGLAVDPLASRIYFAAGYGSTLRSESLSARVVWPTANPDPPLVTGSAPMAGAAFPHLISAPVELTAPSVTPARAAAGEALTCVTSWEEDLPSINYLRQPSSIAYTWTRDGIDVIGENGRTIVPSLGGEYRCAATASNPGGSTRGSGSANAASVDGALVGPPVGVGVGGVTGTEAARATASRGDSPLARWASGPPRTSVRSRTYGLGASRIVLGAHGRYTLIFVDRRGVTVPLARGTRIRARALESTMHAPVIRATGPDTINVRAVFAGTARQPVALRVILRQPDGTLAGQDLVVRPGAPRARR